MDLTVMKHESSPSFSSCESEMEPVAGKVVGEARLYVETSFV